MVTRYCKNVAGDFYVEDKCCIQCGVPVGIAPDIFTFDEQHCFVKKQPVTAEELARTMNAMSFQEVDCIRYSGGNAEIVRRLVETGGGDVCDSPLRDNYQERLRNIAHIRFASHSASSFLKTLTTDARRSKMHDGKPRYRFRSITTKGTVATVRIAWYGAVFHTIAVEMQGEGAFLLRLEAVFPRAGQGLSRLVHEWAAAVVSPTDISWMTEDEMTTGGGQPEPY